MTWIPNKSVQKVEITDQPIAVSSQSIESKIDSATYNETTVLSEMLDELKQINKYLRKIYN